MGGSAYGFAQRDSKQPGTSNSTPSLSADTKHDQRRLLSGVWLDDQGNQLLLVEENQRLLARLLTPEHAVFLGGGSLSTWNSLNLYLVGCATSEALTLSLHLVDDSHLQQASNSTVWTLQWQHQPAAWAPPFVLNRWEAPLEPDLSKMTLQARPEAPTLQDRKSDPSGVYYDGTNIFTVCVNPVSGELVWQQDSGTTRFFGVGVSLPNGLLLLFVAHFDLQSTSSVAQSPIALLFRDMRMSNFKKKRNMLGFAGPPAFPAFRDPLLEREALASSSLSLFNVAQLSTRGRPSWKKVVRTAPDLCGVWSGPTAGKSPRFLAPLHLACTFGNPAVVQSLIEQKADVNLRLPSNPHCSVDDTGSTPLRVVCQAAVLEHKRFPVPTKRRAAFRGGGGEPRKKRKTKPWNFEGVLDVLLQHGADPLQAQARAPAEPLFAMLRSAGELGQSISTKFKLHCQEAPQHEWNHAPARGSVGSLMARRAENMSDAKLLPLVQQECVKHPEHTRLLLSQAALLRPSLLRHLLPLEEFHLCLEAPSALGRTVLMNAVVKGQVETVQELLCAGASVHSQDVRRWQPLHFVSLVQDEHTASRLVVCLVQFGADASEALANSLPESVKRNLGDALRRRECVLAQLSVLMFPQCEVRSLCELVAAYAAPLFLD